MSGAAQRSIAWALALVACAPEDKIVDPCVHHRDEDAHVRAFVVGHHFDVADAETYESYRGSYERHMEAIASCLADDRPNLVVFPAGTGLVALAIGSRGAGARAAAVSSDSIAALGSAYGDPIAVYAARFPGL